ncbi:MAG: S8 family serine peptidase [Chthoniobacteraceae bacterium]
MPDPRFKPKHFFLNERHELPPEKGGGGGKQQPFLDVDWHRKAGNLTRSFERIERRTVASSDPSTRGRLYIIAAPVEEIAVKSDAQDAVDGRKVKKVSFSGDYSNVFARLGLTLIDVHPNRTATVHVPPAELARMRADIANLGQGNRRQQGQWVSIESFDWVPAELKYDKSWLDEIGKRLAEAHIKLQPFLPTFDADAVIRAIEQTLTRFPGNALRGKESGYLGKIWLRAILSAAGVHALADEFAAIQAIHPPILADVSSPAAAPAATGNLELPPATAVTSALPCVGIVDTAVPDEHRILARFRRGTFLASRCENAANDDHGSSVTSRVVFGDLDFGASATLLPPASCSFYEIRTADNATGQIRPESVAAALSNVTSSAPDVRVFNLSFDTKQSLEALAETAPTYFRQIKKVMEDLDNFAFDEDAVLVIAAGNVPEGNIPQPRYPKHQTDKRWALHAFPRCFNALTCGGIISRISAAGLGEPGAPSPFSRLGPGFASSRKPDFSAPAGNANADYSRESGLGVWAISASAERLEVFGTSHAAPLLAREAAFVFDELRRCRACPPSVRPYACTAKAILALTANDVGSALPSEYTELARHALGFGNASVEPLRQPNPESALFFWQGFAERAGDKLRVRIPIPSDWLRSAVAPQLRICIAWDSPVNSVADSWACRDVSLTLCATEDANGASGSRRKAPSGYPLYSRTWDLRKAAEKTPPSDEFWIVEMSYEQIAAYAAGHVPTPIQRIAFAAELRDHGESPLSPQPFVQKLPIAAEMTRFSAAPIPSRQPLAVISEF